MKNLNQTARLGYWAKMIYELLTPKQKWLKTVNLRGKKLYLEIMLAGRNSTDKVYLSKPNVEPLTSPTSDGFVSFPTIVESH
jgi:hypothetical protein